MLVNFILLFMGLWIMYFLDSILVRIGDLYIDCFCRVKKEKKKKEKKKGGKKEKKGKKF